MAPTGRQVAGALRPVSMEHTGMQGSQLCCSLLPSWVCRGSGGHGQKEGSRRTVSSKPDLRDSSCLLSRLTMSTSVCALVAQTPWRVLVQGVSAPLQGGPRREGMVGGKPHPVCSAEMLMSPGRLPSETTVHSLFPRVGFSGDSAVVDASEGPLRDKGG